MQVTINEQLLRQAHRITGLESDRDLLEYGLRLAIAAQSINSSRRHLPTSGSFGKASDYLRESRPEPPDAPSVYQGPPLSLEEMDASIVAEAARHK